MLKEEEDKDLVYSEYTPSPDTGIAILWRSRIRYD
jgi:hypothetical protein